MYIFFFFFFQAEDGIRDRDVTGVQTCALPISFALEPLLELDPGLVVPGVGPLETALRKLESRRSEEHTSELQSHHDIVCRLLLEKKKQTVEQKSTRQINRNHRGKP